MERMTRVRALKGLRVLKEFQDSPRDDPEAAHSQADEILCKFVESLGYKDVADAWRAIEPKWYA